MDYISANKEYFKDFVAIDFDEYINWKRGDGVWGDDLEL
jgi:hypothetical protein